MFPLVQRLLQLFTRNMYRVVLRTRLVSSVDPDFSRPLIMHRGENAAYKFVRDLQKEAKQLCYEHISTPKTMIFNTEDSLSFTNATTCHICTKPLADDDSSS